jgi:hypothetical protein
MAKFVKLYAPVYQWVCGSGRCDYEVYPDGFILQHGEFSPLSEFIGELRRLWNFGYSSFRKRYYQKSELPHRIIMENFIRGVNTGSEFIILTLKRKTLGTSE